MATDFTQDAVLHFLQKNGGTVKNADLLLHFGYFLRDHADRDRNRELFKKFVNSVATVRQTDGVSHVVLRKKFKGHVPGGGVEEGSGLTPWFPAGKSSDTSPENTNLKTPLSADPRRPKLLQREEGTPAPPGETAKKTVLPAAGLILNNNNNVETNFNIKHKQVNRTPEPPGRPATAQVLQPVPSLTGPLPGITPVIPALRETSQHVPVSEPIRGKEAQPEGSLHQQPPTRLHPQVAPRRARQRQSYKSAVSFDDDDDDDDVEEDEEEMVPMRRASAGGVWPLNVPLSDTGKSASSPCLIDQPLPPSHFSSSSSSSGVMPPKIYIQDIERNNRTPWGTGVGLRGRCAGPGLDPAEFVSTRRSLPSEAEHCVPAIHQSTEAALHRNIQQDRRYSQPADVQLVSSLGSDQRQRLSSSHSSIFSHSSDAGFCSSSCLTSSSPRASRGTSSSENLHSRADELVGVANIHDSQDPAGRPVLWHLSTGDLCDDQGESSEGSVSSPQLRQRPAVARRLSSRLRSRMCRSMGADLDHLLQEEAAGGGGMENTETARLRRLHRISSSLSLRYNLSSSSLSSCSTPPRCHSLADLVEGVDGRGEGKKIPTATEPTAHNESRSRQPLVPLEPKEHVWLVKAAAGTWPDIYSLFREDSSLLNRRDFISGFTVLHWIAKHGDHRVLNTLWYGVEKAGMSFDVNARATSGHTPLHIATIHGNKNIIRLLVNKFCADVRMRDNAGKRPWQYLSCTAPIEVFQLLGAPARAAVTGEGGGAGGVDSNWEQQQQQQQKRRRTRHHLSSASSGGRPLTVATTNVKRSSSLAAFLKHKSLQRFYGQQSDTSV
ncbi:uncharacterized protein sowahb [Parambassis ranga]|uniref:Uncharacterized protein sowahb n=1 Tax=Parambassis ranga TaxID=210632 RepID=A0A6P7JCM2_9TELE|nr:uncharacterized protein LOC114444196 [Parambassis ranga]